VYIAARVTADAPAEQAEARPCRSSESVSRTAQCSSSEHELLESHLSVGVVRLAPVDEEHVEARVDEVLHERVSRLQIEDARAVDQREDEQYGNGMPTLSGAVSVQRRVAMRPHDVSRRHAERCVGRRRMMLANSIAAVPRRESWPTDSRFRRVRFAGLMGCAVLRAQGLHLLQQRFELVLGAGKLASETV